MIQKLVEKIEELGNPTVVGLDPTLALIPNEMKERYFEKFGKTAEAVSEMFFDFNKEIIDSVFDIVPAVKPQIAMYENFGLDGLSAYIKTCKYASEKGMIVIGDIKRGDISSTATAYAAHLTGADIEGTKVNPWCEDAITVNPYLGSDGIIPFVDACKASGKGIFILVKTSNPSSIEVQDLLSVKENETGNILFKPKFEMLYERIAKYVESWGSELIAPCGFSEVGAVVGATHPGVGKMLRKSFPTMFFLVPGYGAQGASAEDLRGFFNKNKAGCIVNSSRGIIGAWKNNEGLSVGDAARKASIEMRDDLAHALNKK